MLCERKALLKPVLYLSYFFKRYRQEYYEQLQSVRDRGTWEEWLAFFLRGIVEVSTQAVETARRILLLREDHRHLITEKFGRAAGNGHRVLERLYQQPITSVKEVRDLIGTTNPTANDLVARMVDAKILEVLRAQARNRRFIYGSYARLFGENEAGAAG